jgi:hypothetical protein
MTNQHPIIPPLELLDKWDNLPLSTQQIFVIAAQWGADQELEACCEWVSKYLPYLGDFPMPEDKLRVARRPKLSSLKEQALAALLHLDHGQHNERCLIIRRALEALPE